MSRAKIAVGASIIFLSVQLSLWAAPNTIHYQGRITDNIGNPVPGASSVQFKIYTSAIGGDEIWASHPKSVDANAVGLFSTTIGPIEDPNIFTRDPLCFLEVLIGSPGGDTLNPLRPRQELTAVPFSLNAEYSTKAAIASDVVENSISSDKIQPGAVRSIHIKDKSIGPDDISDDAIFSSHIAPDSITSKHIRRGSIIWVNLATDAIRSSNILDRTINEEKIALEAIDTPLIRHHAIKADQIGDGAITTPAIKDNAVTSEKIASGAVQYSDVDPILAHRFIPTGMIAIFAMECPQGWTQFTLLDDRFPMGASSYTGEPGGNAVIAGLTLSQNGAHSHTVAPHTHPAGNLKTKKSMAIECILKSDGGACQNQYSHTHPISGDTGMSSPRTDLQGNHTHTVSSDGHWRPPYLGVVFCQKN